MNFDGFSPQTIPRFGSLVQNDDVTELPLGVASDVQNCDYRTQSVGPRDGKGVKLTFGVGNGVRGVGVLRYLAADKSGQENIAIIACTKDGNVWAASPFVPASKTLLTTPGLVAKIGPVTPGLYPQMAQAYNKEIIAQGNLMIGVAPALIVDGATLTCDPVSDKPFGETWQPLTRYRTGQVASPTGNLATNIYYCVTGGITDVLEPIWPLPEGATVTDGAAPNQITWRQLTILCTSGLEAPAAPILVSAVAGTLLAPGATIFLVCTWTNQFGESIADIVDPRGNLANVLQYKNVTGAAVNLNVVLPPIPPDIASLAAQYQILTCNLYGYIAVGVPDPMLYLDPGSYARLAISVPSAALLVNTVPVGALLPLANNAYTTGPGNVSQGVRYMIVLYKTRTGYICGFSGPVPVLCNITVDSRQMLIQNIPIGPYNCAARICAFTVSGQGSAGPYFYIYADDFEDPGLGGAKIKQTSTLIPDNTTTEAYFDFLDSYLTGASDVTNYFDRIEVPFASDVYFSKTLNRVIYTGCLAYPSSFMVSDLEDAEAIRVPGSIVNASLTDGDRTVCWRESGVLQVLYKENSAHCATPNDGDPSGWNVVELWRGSAPCGPRAIDVATADGEKLTAYAHRTGGYIWDGGSSPTLVTKDILGTPEQPGLWDRINWKYSYLIRVCINVRQRIAYFFVPLDGSTTNNVRITVNFFWGLDDPIIFIVRTGREVPNLSGRKWSLDNLDANDAIYVPQRTS